MAVYKHFKLLIAGLAVVGLLSMSTGVLAAEKYKVGISLPEAQNPFYVLLGKVLKKSLEKRGIDAILLSADADVNRQIGHVNDLIAAKVDLIMISPLNLEGPAPAIKAASKAGIPVIMIARRLDNKYKSLWKTYLGFDMHGIGVAKGKWLVKNAKAGKVAMLLGPEGALFAIEQEKGFRSAIEPKGFEVTWARSSVQTRENGLRLTEDALIANPGLVAIYASNDDLALGAVQAVKAAGKHGKVVVLGNNGTPPAMASVHRGDLSMTIQNSPVGFAIRAAAVADDFLRKGEVAADYLVVKFKVVEKKSACTLMPPPLRKKFGMPEKC